MTSLHCPLGISTPYPSMPFVYAPTSPRPRWLHALVLDTCGAQLAAAASLSHGEETLRPWVQRKASGLAEAEQEEKSPMAMAVTALEKLIHQGQGTIERVPACVPVLLGPRGLPGLA